LSRLLKKAHLPRWLRRSWLQRTSQYASLLASSCLPAGTAPPCIWTFLNSLLYRVFFNTLLGGAVLACVLGPAAQAVALTARDMVGREITLSHPPKRIVSLVPSVTETLFALGADPLLVGVTNHCDFPPQAKQKPKIGGMVNPSLEGILSARPDLVFASTEGNRDSTIEQLTSLGIPPYVVSPKTFPGVLESIARIGQLTGREEAAHNLMANLNRRAERVVEATRGSARPRVL